MRVSAISTLFHVFTSGNDYGVNNEKVLLGPDCKGCCSWTYTDPQLLRPVTTSSLLLAGCPVPRILCETPDLSDPLERWPTAQAANENSGCQT